MDSEGLDFYEMLLQCREPSDVETAWQSWLAKIGFARSGMFVVSSEAGTLDVLRHATNWDETQMEDYIKARFFCFAQSCNPLRKHSVFYHDHVECFPVRGKTTKVHDFIDFIHTTCFPAEVSVQINVGPTLRLGFVGWHEGTKREVDLHSKHVKDVFIQAANAGATVFMRLAEGLIYPAQNPLSPREIECLLWLAKGYRHADIAAKLNIDRKTVEMHVVGARRKLKAKTATEAVVIAVLNKYIVP